MNGSDELWVDTADFGRCRLLGNAHTFPGRIAAWSETLGTDVTISRSDVRQASPDAWAWIEGFLAGNEPEFHDFLGIDALAADALPDDDPGWDRYKQAVSEFRSTGSMPTALRARPALPPPPGLSPDPWSTAGGEVLRWNGVVWVPLDPQPQLNFGLLVGTVCDERGHHEISGVGGHHLFCADCGEITEVFAVA
jgi:hypothetical protein